MQDILLEPYGGEILGMSVGRTTLLTGFWAAGTMAGFAWAAKSLGRGGEMYRIAARGLLIGISAFSVIILAEPLEIHSLFYLGAAGVGLGGGLFSVGTLLGAMAVSARSENGIVVGAWGAVQSTAMGCSLLAAGLIKNGVNSLALDGRLGEAMTTRAAGYLTVYSFEIVLLFACLAVIGPLTGLRYRAVGSGDMRLGLAEMPG